MTDDTAHPDAAADSAALEAARSGLFDAPAADKEQPRPESNHVPREGISPPTTDDDDDRAFARELFDSGN